MGLVDERFWAKVNKTEGCWEWTGAKTPGGYGNLRRNGKYWKAHRYMWFLITGESPGELLVCHTCDNRACVRPDHLFLGAQTDNMRDAVVKGRTVRGSRVAGAILTEEQVREILRLKGQVTQNIIAVRFGIARNTVSQIWTGRNWRWLEEAA